MDGNRVTLFQNSKNLLSGVPLCEQPFFSDHFQPGQTDPQVYRIARDMHEKGFAVLEFPDDGFDDVAERIKADLSRRFDWTAWNEQRATDLRVQDAWQFNDDVRRIAVNARILELIEQVYGREAFPFQTLNFPVGTQQHFHSDSVHFSSMPERFMCGVWVALEDIHPDAGPLIYYPGSHTWPIVSNEQIGHQDAGWGTTSQDVYHPLWERLVAHHGLELARFTVKKGSALIWAANLLHGGDKRRDPTRTRWSQVTHYYFEGCRYYTPMLSEISTGSLAFRQPFNILTGQLMANTAPETSAASPVLPAGFDAERYLVLNPDVRNAGADPVAHYLRHGASERRRWR